MTSGSIEFIDKTVQPNHIYQYRVVGCDVFGNKTPYAFSAVTAGSKTPLRIPKNFRFEVLRGSPFRVKILWDDDNQNQTSAEAAAAISKFAEITQRAFRLSEEQSSVLDKVLLNENLNTLAIEEDLKILNLKKEQIEFLEKQKSNILHGNDLLYKIQRRKSTEKTYTDFPLTQNQFIIDEVPTKDFIPFSVSKIEDTFKFQQSARNRKELTSGNITRAFGLPPFLQEGELYFYRVLVFNRNRQSSNYTQEISIRAQPEFSEPVNFKASIDNPRLKPLIVRLSWGIDSAKSVPDHWVIERKTDVSYDTFRVVGKAYIYTEFFDRTIQFGNTYIYRIRSVDVNGGESFAAMAKIST